VQVTCDGPDEQHEHKNAPPTKEPLQQPQPEEELEEGQEIKRRRAEPPAKTHQQQEHVHLDEENDALLKSNLYSRKNHEI
jgi:hypothetical protein